MNQPKFREWDFGIPNIRTPRWHYWGYIDGVWEGTIYGKPHESQGQFTGLLDKQGKEIYEGDIVTVHNFNYGLSIGMPITFNIATGRWEIIWREKHWHPNGDETVKDLPLAEVIDGVEVIGNIYENPELIKREPPHQFPSAGVRC